MITYWLLACINLPMYPEIHRVESWPTRSDSSVWSVTSGAAPPLVSTCVCLCLRVYLMCLDSDKLFRNNEDEL